MYPEMQITIRILPAKTFMLPDNDTKVMQIRYQMDGVDRVSQTIVNYGGVNLNSSDVILTEMTEALKKDWKKLNPYFKEE